jgi:hypothetical protein
MSMIEGAESLKDILTTSADATTGQQIFAGTVIGCTIHRIGTANELGNIYLTGDRSTILYI